MPDPAQLGLQTTAQRLGGRSQTTKVLCAERVVKFGQAGVRGDAGAYVEIMDVWALDVPSQPRDYVTA